MDVPFPSSNTIILSGGLAHLGKAIRKQAMASENIKETFAAVIEQHPILGTYRHGGTRERLRRFPWKASMRRFGFG